MRTLARLALSLVTDRALLEHRAVVLAADREQLRERWRSFAERGHRSAGRVPGGGPGPAWPSSSPVRGHNERGWAANCTAISRSSPPRSTRCARHWTLRCRDIILDEDDARLNTTEFAQPALFAIEVALFRLFESWGIRPDFVTGHSVGRDRRRPRVGRAVACRRLRAGYRAGSAYAGARTGRGHGVGDRR